MKYYAILVAGGSGSRMASAVPKQFLLLNGKPVLMHTLSAFHQSAFLPEIIVVLNVAFHDYWKELCSKHHCVIPHHLVNGGETRFDSVKNGIAITEDPAIIAIHDAVRPLIETEIIDRSFMGAKKNGSAVVAVKSIDSIRRITGNTSISLPREEIYLVQTPQVFQSELLKAAYRQPYNPFFTDDASVVEQFGGTMHIIAGNYDNIKITFPVDLDIAAYLIKKATKNSGL